MAGRARRDARALHRGHPAARDAPVLPLASHRRRTGEAPTDGIEIPSPPDEPVPILADPEIAALLKACAVGRGRPGVVDRAVFLGRRDEVVPRLLLDTGVRVSEPCGLALDDVDLDLDRELADHVRRELGNLAFEVHTKAAQPLAYWIYEVYRDEDAFKAHPAAPYGAVVNSELTDHIEEEGSLLTFLTRLE